MASISLAPSGGDDTAFLQAAINSASALGQELHLEPGTFLVSSTIALSAPVAIVGQRRSGNGFVRIEATAAMNAVLEVTALVDISNIFVCGSAPPFGATRYPTYGIYVAGCGPSRFDRVHVSDCLIDGWHFAAVGINDRGDFRDCSGGQCGVLYRDTALAAAFPHTPAHMQQVGALQGSATSGSLISANALFQTWGVRRGDPILLGSAFAVVLSVQSETALTTVLPISSANAPLAVGVGCGWFEARHGDNNLHNISNGLFRLNAGHGLAMDGLYGHLISGVQFDYNAFHAIRIGVVGSDPVFTPAIIRCYFESNGRKPLLLGATQGLSVISPANDGSGEPWEFASIPHVATGIFMGRGALSPIGDPGTTPSTLESLVLGGFWTGSDSNGLQRASGRQLTPNGPGGYGYVPNGAVDAFNNMLILKSESSTDTAISGLAPPSTGNPTVTLVGGGPMNILLTSSSQFRLRTGTLTLKPFDTISFVHYGSGVWVETTRSIS